jgi:hypothetical protein
MRKPSALEAHRKLACGNAAGWRFFINLAPWRGAGFSFAHYFFNEHKPMGFSCSESMS